MTCGLWSWSVTRAAEQFFPVPGGVSDELAAALGVPALTAYHRLFADGPLDTGPVLVAGGAGAVGQFARTVTQNGAGNTAADHASACG